MAKLPSSAKSGINSLLHGFSFYTMKGVDGVIMRKKGGSKKSKKSDKNSVEARNRNEFAIRSRAVAHINSAIRYHKELADYNYTGTLNGLMRNVQLLDEVNDLGQRGIFLSKNKDIVKGFSLNKNYLFNSVIRYPFKAKISKDDLSAIVHVLSIVPGIDFHTHYNFPYSVIVNYDFLISKNFIE